MPSSIEGFALGDVNLPLKPHEITNLLSQSRFCSSTSLLSRELANLTVLFRMLVFFADILSRDAAFRYRLDKLWGLAFLDTTHGLVAKVVSEHYVKARQPYLLLNDSARTSCLLVKLVDEYITLQITPASTNTPIDVSERVTQWEHIRDNHPGMFLDSRKPLNLVGVEYTPNIYEKTQSMFNESLTLLVSSCQAFAPETLLRNFSYSRSMAFKDQLPPKLSSHCFPTSSRSIIQNIDIMGVSTFASLQLQLPPPPYIR